MMIFYFVLLIGLSNALFYQQESNMTYNITSGCYFGIKTTASATVPVETGATGSQCSLFPTSPSLRLPLPLWNNATNSTQNFSNPTQPSVSSSAISFLRDSSCETLVYKALYIIAASIPSLGCILGVDLFTL